MENKRWIKDDEITYLTTDKVSNQYTGKVKLNPFTKLWIYRILNNYTGMWYKGEKSFTSVNAAKRNCWKAIICLPHIPD